MSENSSSTESLAGELHLDDARSNTLFPVFLKLEELRLLVVGGGAVALEKLNAVLSNSPAAEIRLVAPEIHQEIVTISREALSLTLSPRVFLEEDLDNCDLVIVAVNNSALAASIKEAANARGLLVNVADQPALCDFYLSSVVRKGALKIAISTNGQSPTLAKRMRELLETAVPDETDKLIANLNTLRNKLSGDLKQKVEQLNRVTDSLVQPEESALKKRWRRFRVIAFYTLAILALMVTGHLFFTYVPFASVGSAISGAFQSFDNTLLLWIAGGFLAQMIDGSLGMAYGVSSTTFLMSFGISPAVASASMHASEIAITGASSLVYLRYRNINTKLFKTLLVPGALGAIAGATLTSLVDLHGAKELMQFVKPGVAVYTLLLGTLILRKALLRSGKPRKKIRRIGPLAAIGGFLDSVGGGGWGPIVTSSLVAGGRDLRYSVGSAHAAKFFVALFSSVTFFFILGLEHWKIIVGLIIGGLVAAPVSIRLSTRISVRNGLIMVGLLVIIISLRIIISALL